MDILTYALARNIGDGGNGALAGLTNISVDENGYLSFIFEGRDPITTTTAIPAATAEQIKTTIINNPVAIKEAIGIPTDMENLEIADVIHNAVTSITIGNEPIILNSTDHVLNLPLAQGNIPGLVKGVSVSDPDEFNPKDEVHKGNINKIYINNDGTMSIYRLSVSKLVQLPGDELIMGDVD